MADSPQQAPAQEAPPAPTEQQVNEKALALEIATAEAAAKQYYDDQKIEQDKDQRQRDAQGRFVSPEPKPEPAVEPAPEPAPPKLDPVWIEAARRSGFNDAEIAGFKDEREVQERVAVRRLRMLQDAGIDPADFATYRQWRTSQVQQPAPVAPAAIEPLKLEIAEEELAPELVKPLRTVEAYANKLKETLGAENQQLRQTVSQLQGLVQQSVEARGQAEREAQNAAQWDAAAKAVPGFVEVMGLPSEVKRLPSDDPRVQNYVAFRAYFEPAWNKYATILGPNSVELQRVVADAFQASPFSRQAPAQGKNGTAPPAVMPGSVVRSAAHRTSVAEPLPGDLEGELKRIADTMKVAWSNSGDDNPFRYATRPL